MQSAFWRLFRDFGAAQLPPDAAIRVILPNGAESIVGNAHARPADLATVRVIDAALFGKVVMRSDIGLGEGACASNGLVAAASAPRRSHHPCMQWDDDDL